MEKTHTDAIPPANQAHDEVLNKNAIEGLSLARRRRVAWFAIAGITIGASFTYLNGNPLTLGILWGGVSAAALGWFLTGRVKA